MVDVNPFVPDDVRQERLNICYSCPFVAENKDVCTKCMCHTGFKSKFKWSKCPAGYWPIPEE